VPKSSIITDEVWAAWCNDWNAVLAGVGAKGPPAFVSDLVIAPTMSGADVVGLLPSSKFPDVLLDVAVTRTSGVGFHWRLFELNRNEHGRRLEAPMFKQDTPQWGGCHAAESAYALWNIRGLPALHAEYPAWVNMFRSWQSDESSTDYIRGYGDPWFNKFPFIQVGDGDMIGIETGEENNGQVVYLCHDEYCSLHGKVLGCDFADFITRWSRIGCVGPEGWMLQLFYEKDEFAAADSQVVQDWRGWLGMPT
jgi:hypothetical protein